MIQPDKVSVLIKPGTETAVFHMRAEMLFFGHFKIEVGTSVASTLRYHFK